MRKAKRSKSPRGKKKKINLAPTRDRTVDFIMSHTRILYE